MNNFPISLHPTASLRRAGLEIAAVSFVVLFQELALIRWLPVQVRVIAYFPNLILISSFLGLGIGALRGRKKSMLWLWPVALAVVVAVALGLSKIAFTADSVSEHLWLLYYDLGPDAMVIDGIRLPIILLFVLSACSFVPLVQFVGERLDLFRREASSRWGYSFHLLGSRLARLASRALLPSRPVLCPACLPSSRPLRSSCPSHASRSPCPPACLPCILPLPPPCRSRARTSPCRPSCRP